MSRLYFNIISSVPCGYNTDFVANVTYVIKLEEMKTQMSLYILFK